MTQPRPYQNWLRHENALSKYGDPYLMACLCHHYYLTPAERCDIPASQRADEVRSKAAHLLQTMAARVRTYKKSECWITTYRNASLESECDRVRGGYNHFGAYYNDKATLASKRLACRLIKEAGGLPAVGTATKRTFAPHNAALALDALAQSALTATT